MIHCYCWRKPKLNKLYLSVLDSPEKLGSKLKLIVFVFEGALKVCTDASNSPDKVNPVFSLYKNLIALERASDKDESAIRTCRRLLKASPKKVELRLCMAALQQVSGHAAGVVTVYKEALEACNKHAQVAYSAAKYFIETVCVHFCLNFFSCESIKSIVLLVWYFDLIFLANVLHSYTNAQVAASEL